MIQPKFAIVTYKIDQRFDYSWLSLNGNRYSFEWDMALAVAYTEQHARRIVNELAPKMCANRLVTAIEIN